MISSLKRLIAEYAMVWVFLLLTEIRSTRCILQTTKSYLSTSKMIYNSLLEGLLMNMKSGHYLSNNTRPKMFVGRENCNLMLENGMTIKSCQQCILGWEN